MAARGRSDTTSCRQQSGRQPGLSPEDPCHALHARGITGQFETHQPGIAYSCMTVISRKRAGLTIREPDGVDVGRPVHFSKWVSISMLSCTGRSRSDEVTRTTITGIEAAPRQRCLYDRFAGSTVVTINARCRNRRSTIAISVAAVIG